METEEGENHSVSSEASLEALDDELTANYNLLMFLQPHLTRLRVVAEKLQIMSSFNVFFNYPTSQGLGTDCVAVEITSPKKLLK